MHSVATVPLFPARFFKYQLVSHSSHKCTKLQSAHFHERSLQSMAEMIIVGLHRTQNNKRPALAFQFNTTSPSKALFFSCALRRNDNSENVFIHMSASITSNVILNGTECFVFSQRARTRQRHQSWIRAVRGFKARKNYALLDRRPSRPSSLIRIEHVCSPVRQKQAVGRHTSLGYSIQRDSQHLQSHGATESVVISFPAGISRVQASKENKQLIWVEKRLPLRTSYHHDVVHDAVFWNAQTLHCHKSFDVAIYEDTKSNLSFPLV